MSNYILNQINLLEQSFCKCNFDIINNIKLLNKSTSNKLNQKYDINKIKVYTQELNNIRLQIKDLIHTYELNIYDLDKKKIVNKNIDKSVYMSIEDKLYSLNYINEQIKETLKNIIVKIK